MAELRSYTPTYQERVGDALARVGDMLRYSNRQRLRDIGKTAADVTAFIPLMDAWRQFLSTGQTPSAMDQGLMALDMVPGGAALSAAIAPAAKVAKKKIRAFHGSPHDFDKFSMDAIGTGEGAQVYGHGLYFADSEDVAKKYRETLTRSQLVEAVHEGTRGQGAGGDGARAIARNIIEIADSEGIEALDSYIAPAGFERAWKSGVDAAKKADNQGRMFQVEIDSDPEDFLDWNAPLSQQPEAVQELARHYNTERGPTGKELKGEMIYRGIGGRAATPPFNNASKSGHDKDATRVLSEAGIPGIKYLDGFSRASGGGTRNYVVFDDRLVSILRKYGIAGAAIMGGGLAASSTNTPAEAATP